MGDFLGSYLRLVWVRTFGAGEGGEPRMDANEREWGGDTGLDG